MRRKGTNRFFVLTGVALLFLYACGGGGSSPSGPPPPTVTTTAATGLTLDGATLTGTVNPNGLATSARFEWGTDSTLAIHDNTAPQALAAGTSVLPVQQQITGLAVGTPYFFRIVASSSAGESKGAIQNFSITPIAPTVTTSAATNITEDNATLNGQVNPNGLATTAWFEWGTDSTLTTHDNTAPQVVGGGIASLPVSDSLTGLAIAQTYYFRAAAMNSAGTQRGSILSFSTENPPPVADAGNDQSVVMGRPVTLDGSGSSTPVGTITSYLWEQVAGQAVVLDNSASVSPTFTAPDNVAQIGEVFRFQLTVTNSNLATASDNVDVTVLWGSLDDFSTDTTGSYSPVSIDLNGNPTPGSVLNYDAAGERLEALTGDNLGLIISNALPASDNGVFSVDFFPRVTYPIGGGIWVRLMQDADNYYEMKAFQWDNVLNPGEPSSFRKVVGGVVVEEIQFANVNNYVSQDPNPTQYPVTITFTPTASTVQAFGETITLNADPTVINVSTFEIQVNQQDAYLDNIQLLAVP